MPLNCALKNGQNGKFSVMYILPRYREKKNQRTSPKPLEEGSVLGRMLLAPIQTPFPGWLHPTPVTMWTAEGSWLLLPSPEKLPWPKEPPGSPALHSPPCGQPMAEGCGNTKITCLKMEPAPQYHEGSRATEESSCSWSPAKNASLLDVLPQPCPVSPILLLRVSPQ